jgi:asparagine synthase (glutamine-hydrolysing)
MCGIAGILGINPNEKGLRELLDPITHRGEQKYRYEMFISPEVALGMHRLGIVDENSGNQPFQSHDKRVTAIFNGEIYNHLALRQLLSPEFNFNSLCDGEVILNAYLKWSTNFVNYLDGKFALAIYDGWKKELILARDPMGVKPLYYADHQGRFFFSSEVKALAKIIASEILELPPGTIWVNSKEKKYFILGDFNSIKKTNKRDSEYMPILRNTLKQAVEKRINKEDSKIACLLSGGVDSSVITYLASHVHSNVIAYTLSEPKKNSADLQAAIKLCDFLGLKHIIVSPSVEEMKDFYLKYGVYMTESFEPVLVRNAVAYHFVCKQVAADGFKYCLNGEGADELFGGYDFVREASIGKHDELIRRSLSIIHNSYLKMADRASMYTTLEARVPYMDKAFVTYSLGLPPHARIEGDMNKVALRNLFKDELPIEITHRKKVGMNEGAGFGVNRPDQSIYYNAVKAYYETQPQQYNQDLNLCFQENDEGTIDLDQIEEVYNFARYVECGFKKLKDGTKRLQLNTSLRKELAA